MARALLIYIISLCSLLFSPTSYANGFKELFTSKAGGKSIDQSEGKDLSPFSEPNACRVHAPWGVPDTENKELKKRLLYFCKATYTSVYDTQYKMPIFTLEVLNTFDTKNMAIGKKLDYYIESIELPSSLKQKVADYNNSYYRPGHMASPENMFVRTKKLKEEEILQRTEYAMQESYNMLNIAPMVGLNFQSGLWLELELYAKILAIEKGEIFVVTGPIFLNNESQGTIGNSKIPVPTHFFKIIVNPNAIGAISYILPNKEIVTKNTKKIINPSMSYYCGNQQPCTLNNFIVPIQEIERLTGFTLFPLMSPYYSKQLKLDLNAGQLK